MQRATHLSRFAADRSDMVASVDGASPPGRLYRVAAPAPSGPSPWNDRLMAHFLRLGATPDGAERLVESSDAVLTTIRQAVESGHWGQALELVRVAEPAFLLAGRWGAWASSLELGLVAARALGDLRAEGWVLHEQGMRALALGSFHDAFELLSQALRIRLASGTAEEAALTRFQLAQVPARHGAAS